MYQVITQRTGFFPGEDYNIALDYEQYETKAEAEVRMCDIVEGLSRKSKGENPFISGIKGSFSGKRGYMRINLNSDEQRYTVWLRKDGQYEEMSPRIMVSCLTCGLTYVDKLVETLKEQTAIAKEINNG